MVSIPDLSGKASRVRDFLEDEFQLSTRSVDFSQITEENFHYRNRPTHYIGKLRCNFERYLEKNKDIKSATMEFAALNHVGSRMS
jgi:hypothetical protein